MTHPADNIKKLFEGRHSFSTDDRSKGDIADKKVLQGGQNVCRVDWHREVMLAYGACYRLRRWCRRPLISLTGMSETPKLVNGFGE